MTKAALPSITEDLAPRKRVDLKAIRPAAVDDAAVAENSRKIGTEWGAQTSLTPVEPSPPPAPAPKAEAPVAAPEHPKVPLASLRIEVPEYLDRELAIRAAEQRVTKQYLVAKALQAAGYRLDDADLVEDKRKAKKR
ncbi:MULTISPECIES: hypothetical protein [Methylobacterium]|uniref:Uncharacterized protein n=1 Tax=Methylobacterium isbiliense TaxID=315478 RepID=A0ABQ4SHZ7_9HYPH|nr:MULTISPECIES: hypothetical protein [Methylobacterium]MBY0296863.1 hypothetical protein [Methylobacterium sp.]MDN3626767.1 hypothetical protein [Methylobacterium isbiliense]GJE02194.1 hypothetical protein GMJLKIPL_4138 [Methylobacterium isbiliense]